MNNARYLVASYDDFYDIIGVIETDIENYDSVLDKFPVHSAFTDKKDALREAKRLSKQNGAFFVETGMDKQYLVFRSEDDNGKQCEYLTTRSAVAKALEVNQENGIAWETVDAVLEDAKIDKDVGIKLECWMDRNGILQKRNAQEIEKLKFYTGKSRNELNKESLEDKIQTAQGKVAEHSDAKKPEREEMEI